MLHSHNQNRVLVHCAMGRSRSATMIIMYLMQKFQMPWTTALDIAKDRREIVDPNDGFLKKLEEYEGKQYRSVATDLQCESAKLIIQPMRFSSDSSTSSEDLMEKRPTIDI